MTELAKFLDSNNFFMAAKIVRSSDGIPLIFEIEPDFKAKGAKDACRGWVYAWVNVSMKTPIDVKYVGKVGQTQAFKDRCAQHQRGFYTCLAGKKNAERIKSFFSNNPSNEIFVYARNSNFGSEFGTDGVSMCEFEEMALIKKFKADNYDLWNFA